MAEALRMEGAAAAGLPLDGILVVSLEQAIAAPFCTRQLAELGARVIKIERPGGGDFGRYYDTRLKGLCSHFAWVNRSKESLTLDVKHAEAGAILANLVARADVLVQNLAPGAAERLGLSYARLSASHPRLIVCDISGYGDDGPYRDKKAYDLMIQSESGFVSISGTPDEPSKSGASIADIAAGMYAYSNILAALLQRGRSGRGCRVEVSMLECMVEWMTSQLYYAYDGQSAPARAGAAHATIYPYGPFPAGDGKLVMLGIQNEREWLVFCDKVLRQPQLAQEPRFATNAARSAARAELREIIAAAFAPLTAAQVVELLEQAQIANARLNTLDEVWEHPQLRARRRWLEVDSPVGPIPAPAPPGLPDGFERRLGAVPRVGQHADAILAEIGYDPAAIAALHAAGAV